MASLQDEGNIAGGNADMNMDSSGSATREHRPNPLISTRHPPLLLCLPDLVMDKILNLMTSLDRLRFRMVHPELRSFVADFRPERSSDPWLLLSMNVPKSDSFRLSDGDTRTVEQQHGACLALEMETMGWIKLRVPGLGPHPGPLDEYESVQVKPAGSSGLVVLWRTPPKWPLVIGNFITNKWHTIAVNPNHQEERDLIGARSAAHLVLDGKHKEKPLKLVHFVVTDKDHLRIGRFVTVSAHAYCFSTKKWDTSVEVLIARPDLYHHKFALYRISHDTISICSHDGVVFLLISHLSSASPRELMRFMVLAYSEALGEFAVAVPWSDVGTIPDMCKCGWDQGLAFDPYACPAYDPRYAAAAEHESPQDRDERNKQDYFTGHTIHRPVWMKQVSAKGLKLLVACQRTLQNGRVGMIETTALTNCPRGKIWEMSAASATTSSRTAQLDQVVGDWCQSTFQLGDGTGSVRGRLSYTRLWVKHAAHMAAWRSGQHQSTVLVVALHGPREGVYKSLNADAWTQLQVGTYNMDTGVLRMAKAPLSHKDLKQFVRRWMDPGVDSFSEHFTIQAFHPSVTHHPSFT